MRGFGIGIVALAVLATPPEARADDQDYGEQIALADGASVGVFFAANRIARSSDSESVSELAVGLGVGSYLLLAPAVHLVGHGREDRAALSLAMRLVPTTALVTMGRCEGGEEAIGCIAGHLLIAFFGALAVTAVDILVVSDGPAPEPWPVMLGGRF